METELRQLLNALPQVADGTGITQCRPVAGGCCHQAFELQLRDGRRWFAKYGPFAMLEAEQRGLAALCQWIDSSCLLVPEPLALVTGASRQALLLLPWQQLARGDQTLLGRGLARLHQRSAANGPAERGPGWFGWEWEGYIGLGRQSRGWCQRWGEAFVQLRLRPQLEAARQWGLESEPLEPWLQKLSERLEQHHPVAALVHGDLWGGNAAVLADGRGLVFDPASWWADREVDLAMTQCFGGFSRAFYRGYEQEWPLPPGADRRLEIYNLYHLLNHANLFGGGYRQQCRAILKQPSSLLW